MNGCPFADLPADRVQAICRMPLEWEGRMTERKWKYLFARLFYSNLVLIGIAAVLVLQHGCG